MPGQARGQRRPGQRQSTRGDATGKITEQMKVEQAEEIAARADELGMVTDVEHYDDDVTDFTPESLEGAALGEAVDEDDLEDVTAVGMPDAPIIKAHPRERRKSLLVDGVGKGNPKDLVVVRTNGDYPEVTLGAGIHVDFEAGRKYTVERWIAQHLEEKDMLASVN